MGRAMTEIFIQILSQIESGDHGAYRARIITRVIAGAHRFQNMTNGNPMENQMSSFRNLLKKRFGSGTVRRRWCSGRFARRFKALESRHMLAVTAIFSPSNGVLSVYGDSADNTVAISRNPAGNILVNSGV